MNYQPVYIFFIIALLQCFRAFCEILTSEWLADVIQFTAPYVTRNVRNVNVIEDLHK